MFEFGNAWYIPLRTALDAGVFATYPKSSKSLPLHMGASLASMYYLSWTSLNIAVSMVFLDIDSKLALAFLLRRHAASSFCPRNIVQLLPKLTLPFLLDDYPHFFERFLIAMLLGQRHLFIEMFGLELFPIFLVEFTLLFALHNPLQYFSHAQPHWVLNIASPSCLFQIFLILDFPLMPSDDQVVHLHPPNPDGHFG
jgi:hypothetical protein